MASEIVDLDIERLVHGGRGVGRWDGKAIFVADTAVGDTVRCRIVRQKRRYAEAELVEILLPSPDRRAPSCPLVPECGGCQWQHLAYPAQLQAKTSIFSDALVRTAGVDPSRITAIIPAPGEWHYRCRAQVKCRWSGRELLTGFYRGGTHRIVPFAACPVLDPRLNALLPGLRSCLEGYAHADRIPQCDLSVDADGQVVLIVHLLAGDAKGLAAALQPLVAESGAGLFVQTGRKETLQPLSALKAQRIRPEPDDALALEFPPGGFVQVNQAQNRQLVAEALAGCCLQGDEKALDLYCGIGNFSLPLARHCRSVTGVEEFAPAIDAARRNAVANGMHNLAFHAQSAEAFLSRTAPGDYDLVLLDPPRSGAYGAVRELVRLRPRRIVYVSCDPATLARDLVPLLHSGYRLEHACPVDMFPQTSHIEGVAVLALDSEI